MRSNMKKKIFSVSNHGMSMRKKIPEDPASRGMVNEEEDLLCSEAWVFYVFNEEEGPRSPSEVPFWDVLCGR